MNWFRQRKSVKKVQGEGSVYTLWEQDLDLTEQPPLGLFDEYLEMGRMSSLLHSLAMHRFQASEMKIPHFM